MSFAESRWRSCAFCDVALALLVQAALEPARVERGNQRDAEARREGETELDQRAALCRSVDGRDVGLLLDEGAEVQGTRFLRHPQDNLAPWRHPAAQHRARVLEGGLVRAADGVLHDVAELDDLAAQTIQTLALGRRHDGGLVLTERVIHHAVGVAELATVDAGGLRIGIQQQVANVDRAQEHLPLDRREQLLGTGIAVVDGFSLTLHLGHPLGQAVSGEQPQPERQSEPDDERRPNCRALEGDSPHGAAIILPPTGRSMGVLARASGALLPPQDRPILTKKYLQ